MWLNLLLDSAMKRITIGKINGFLKYLVNMLKTMLGALIILFRVVSDNRSRYLPKSSNENALYITSTSNVFVARWVIPSASIPPMYFVTIH